MKKLTASRRLYLMAEMTIASTTEARRGDDLEEVFYWWTMKHSDSIGDFVFSQAKLGTVGSYLEAARAAESAEWSDRAAGIEP